MEIIRIELTQKQTKMLQSLFDRVETDYAKDAPGSILAQIYEGHMKVVYCEAKIAEAVRAITF